MAKRSPSKAPWGTTDDQPRESTTVPTYFKPGSYTGIMDDMATKMAFGTPHHATKSSLALAIEGYTYFGIQPFQNARIREHSPGMLLVEVDIFASDKLTLQKKGLHPKDLLEIAAKNCVPVGIGIEIVLNVRS